MGCQGSKNSTKSPSTMEKAKKYGQGAMNTATKEIEKPATQAVSKVGKEAGQATTSAVKGAESKINAVTDNKAKDVVHKGSEAVKTKALSAESSVKNAGLNAVKMGGGAMKEDPKKKSKEDDDEDDDSDEADDDENDEDDDDEDDDGDSDEGDSDQ